MLARQGLDAAREASGEAPVQTLSDVRLLTPVPDAGKIICIGRNYRRHVAEGNMKQPEHPSVFFRLHSSLMASGQAIVRPRLSGDFDFEGELALVIGRPGQRLSPECGGTT